MEVPVFLDAKPWMTIPFKHVKKDVHTRLYDVMVQLPRLLYEAATFGALGPGLGPLSEDPPSEDFVSEEEEEDDSEPQQQQDQLIRRYIKLSQQLQQWHDSLDSAWKGSVERQPRASWPGYALSFAATVQPNVWLSYWIAQLALFKSADRAASASEWLAVQADRNREQALQAANNICASYEYVGEAQRGAMAIMSYTMPLRKAMGFYRAQGMAVEADLASAIVKRVLSSGFAVTKTLVEDIPCNSPSLAMFGKMTS